MQELLLHLRNTSGYDRNDRSLQSIWLDAVRWKVLLPDAKDYT